MITHLPVFAEHTPRGLVNVETRRPLRETIPAYYSCAGSVDLGAFRIVRYTNHRGPGSLTVVARKANR